MALISLCSGNILCGAAGALSTKPHHFLISLSSGRRKRGWNFFSGKQAFCCHFETRGELRLATAWFALKRFPAWPQSSFPCL
jgi:hypothetical protein